MLQLMRKGCSYTYPPLVQPGTHLYSWVNWSNVEWKKLPTILAPQHRIRTWVLLVESPTPYRWATALYSTIYIHIFWDFIYLVLVDTVIMYNFQYVKSVPCVILPHLAMIGTPCSKKWVSFTALDVYETTSWTWYAIHHTLVRILRISLFWSNIYKYRGREVREKFEYIIIIN